MKKLFQFVNFSLIASVLFFYSANSIAASSKNLNSVYKLKKYISSIKKKELMHSLRMIVYKSKPNRFYGTPGHKNIQNLLIETLMSYKKDELTSIKIDEFKLDLTVGKQLYQSDFDTKIVPAYKPQSEEYKKWNKFNKYMQSMIESKKDVIGKNIIWERQGESDKTLVITAHYDTVSHDPKSLEIDQLAHMPGADYNASSVSILLGLVKLLSPLPLKHSVKIVFLDAQSLGFLGAYDYAKKLKKQSDKIVGVINLEMLGHDSKHFDTQKKHRNFKVYARDSKKDPEQTDINLYQNYSQLAKKSNQSIRFNLERNNFNNSDNFRFWEQGIPALTFTQNWEDDFNKKYQSKNDFPETINQSTLFHAFKYLAIATLGFTQDVKK